MSPLHPISRSAINRRFTLRTLLSVMTGCAFVAFVAGWIATFNQHPLKVALLVLPWVAGSFVGITMAARGDRSTLLGAIVGGTLGTFICPGLIILFLYANGMNGVTSLSSNLFWPLGLAACGSGLLAAFVGIPREGIHMGRTSEKT